MKSIMGLLAILSLQGFAWAGPISGGGGGAPVVFQAQAIAAIMQDISSRMDVAKMFMHTNSAGSMQGETIKSIELVNWASGTSHYVITTDYGCQLFVDTIADDTDPGTTTFRTQWQPRACK